VFRRRSTRSHRTWPQRLLIATNVLLVIACLGSAAALTQIRSTINDVPVVDIGSSLTPTAEVTEPRNFLIIGTDSDEGIDESDPITRGRDELGELADVIMILRVDPRDSSARLLSIPRDSRVAVAPDWDMGRINTAISGVQGARNLVQTIKRNFGISIDNYVEIDWKSFRDLVEVIDGVPVYFTTPARDRETGLVVEEPGCVVLDEVQALAYARSRHYEYRVDGEWEKDISSDHGRIARQQDFIKRALRRASDKGVRNPSTAIGIVNAAAAAVTLDDTLDVGTILTLVQEFQDFNPNSLESQQVPTEYAPRGGVAYEEILWDAAEPLIEPFRGVEAGRPLTPDQVIVDVRGREAIEDEMEGYAGQLDAAGFDAEVVQGGSLGSDTVVRYGPRGREAALLLAAQLEGTPEVELDEDIAGYRVELSIGSDFAGVRAEPLPLDQLPPDLVPPTTDDDGDAAVEEEGPSTSEESGEEETSTSDVPGERVDPVTDPELGGAVVTTTSVPGVAPTDSQAAAACR
jgi:LCP family protein required for cell wall assembly